LYNNNNNNILTGLLFWIYPYGGPAPKLEHFTIIGTDVILPDQYIGYNSCVWWSFQYFAAVPGAIQKHHGTEKKANKIRGYIQPFYGHYKVNMLASIPDKSWTILLDQGFTAHMPFLMAISTFGSVRKYQSCPQQCCLY